MLCNIIRRRFTTSYISYNPGHVTDTMLRAFYLDSTERFNR